MRKHTFWRWKINITNYRWQAANPDNDEVGANYNKKNFWPGHLVIKKKLLQTFNFICETIIINTWRLAGYCVCSVLWSNFRTTGVLHIFVVQVRRISAGMPTAVFCTSSAIHSCWTSWSNPWKTQEDSMDWLLAGRNCLCLVVFLFILIFCHWFFKFEDYAACLITLWDCFMPH